MNLIIDEGNSSVKAAIYQSDRQIVFKVIDALEVEKQLLSWTHECHLKACIITSVVVGVEERFAFLKTYVEKMVIVNSTTKVPFKNRYATPKTLGIDRIALATATFTQYPNKNVLVIDAGTCITFDFINKEGEYLGGAIAPGIRMRLKAMHHFTSKLPLITDSDFDINKFIGDSTKNAMLSGVYNNVVCEIEGVILKYQIEFKNLTVVLTGGDHLFLAKNLKNPIFAKPFFVLEGLNALLTHQ